MTERHAEQPDEQIDWWLSLRHGGQLIDRAHLDELPEPRPFPWKLPEDLRSAVIRLPEEGAAKGDALTTLMDLLLERVTGLTSGWLKGSQVGPEYGEVLLDGTRWKPRRVWSGEGRRVTARLHHPGPPGGTPQGQAAGRPDHRVPAPTPGAARPGHQRPAVAADLRRRGHAGLGRVGHERVLSRWAAVRLRRGLLTLARQPGPDACPGRRALPSFGRDRRDAAGAGAALIGAGRAGPPGGRSAPSLASTRPGGGMG